ncbi:MAG: hypothetical protein ABI148_07620 [Ginsengibacter sp.]
MSQELKKSKGNKTNESGHHDKDWNFDPRNENYYLGKINESGESDDNMRYFTDGKTGRYYRKGEIIPPTETEPVIKEPFLNNSLEGKRKRNFSFRLSDSERKKSNIR